MDKLKPAVFIFLILSSFITLFPPFQWGVERLRTIEERKTSQNIFSDNLPIKEYNFIFSSSKKEFTVNNNTVSLNRVLITSEIILEYVFSIIISLIFYFLYLQFGRRTFGVFIYFILAGLMLLIWSIFGKDFLMLFNPSYEIVLNKEKEVKEKYKDWLNSFSAFTFINGLKEINKSYDYAYDRWNDTYYGWNDSTQKVWRHIKNKIEISYEQLPKINEYLFSYRKENSDKKIVNEIIRSINSRNALDFQINKKEVLKYYPSFTPLPNKYLAASSLLEDIDKIKYDYFKNNFDIDLSYLKVREEYFRSQIDYNSLSDKLKIYITIFIILIFIVLLFYKKLLIVNNLSKLVNA